MLLHFGVPSGKLHVTDPGVADEVQFEAPVCCKATVLPREGPRPSEAVARARVTANSGLGS